MVILTSADTDYLPLGLASMGSQLDNLLQRAQVLGESARGANRLLELHSRIDNFELQRNPRERSLSPYMLQLKEWPLTDPVVEVNYYGQTSWDLISSDYFDIDLITGSFNLYITCKSVRVTYQSGFDFNVDNLTTQTLKAAVGQLALIMEQVELAQAIDGPRDIFPSYLSTFRKFRTL